MVNNGDNSNEKRIWFHVEKKKIFKKKHKTIQSYSLIDWHFKMKNNNFLDSWIRFLFHLFRFFRHIYPKWKSVTIFMCIYSICKNEIHFTIIWISLLRYIHICILIYISIASYARIYYGKGLVCYTSYWTFQK